MSIKITHSRQAGDWNVTCSSCDTEDFFELLRGPWASGQSWPIAMNLADLHRRLHVELDCGHCDRPVQIPRPKQIKRGLIDVGGRLFQIQASGCIEVSMTPTTTGSAS